LKNKINLNNYNNSWYKPGNKLKCICWYFLNILILKNTLFPFSKIKVIILKCFGANIGKGVIIKPGVNIKYPWLLQIGNHVWIGENVWIDNLAQVTIEDHVCISQGAMILCGNHNYKKTTFDLMVNEIILEEGVWIGAKSVVCSGVRCKTHAILCISSIANIDLEPYTVYQGNPAKKIRNRVIEV
jgi:putative colanic acid biosynthesis acetyltransferase WcaF